MKPRRHNMVFTPAPAVMFALAVAVPLVVVSDTAIARPTSERAETLARCVSQAARQFCGRPAALVVTPTSFLAPLPAPVRTGLSLDFSHATRAHLLPKVIDLPPPALV